VVASTYLAHATVTTRYYTDDGAYYYVWEAFGIPARPWPAEDGLVRVSFSGMSEIVVLGIFSLVILQSATNVEPHDVQ